MAVRVALALEEEPIEDVAAGDLEPHVPQVEARADREALLVVEELIILVLAIGAVVVLVVPVAPSKARCRPGRRRR